ncbi:MAG TPA: hypothetical protein VEV19_10815 [Ktedonobacteraceae bacterium]|nr:hypothetical protein [Ktedonobacteraceae bacterium]
MSYIFRGQLCGLICTECPEPLSNVRVRLYRNRADQAVTVLAVAQPKDTATILTDEIVQQKEASLLAEAETDTEGKFSIELGEKENYQGEAFEVDVYCGTVPHQKVRPNPPPPRQFTITTLQPLWRQSENGFLWVWDYCLSARFWCAIHALFGAQVICGHVTTCDTQEPVPGVTVTALDADWLTDDPLGSAVTDAAGKFRIDYTHRPFLVTLFPQLTPFFPNVSGPDVHFRIQLGAVTILDEPKSRGRQPDRNDVEPCFCVELCVEPGQITPTPEGTPHWTQVEFFNVHASALDPAHNILPLGYGGLADESFTFGGAVALQGNCPLKNISAPANSLMFRFLIAEWGWTGGGDGTAGVIPSVPPPAPPSPLEPSAAWKIVPAGSGFQSVGQVYYNDGVNPFASQPVYVTSANQDINGWVKLDGMLVSVPMANGTTSTIAISATNFLRSGLLMYMDSVTISNAHASRRPAWASDKTQAGRSLTPAEQEPIRRYSMIFQVRDATTNIDVYTDNLDSIVLDNSEPVALLNLEELLVNACNPLSGVNTLHLRYTVDHPNLQYFSADIANNNGVVHPSSPLDPMPNENFVPADNYLFRGDASGPNPVTNPGGFPVDITNDPVCAYAVTLRWHTRRLYTGEGSTQVYYCK